MPRRIVIGSKKQFIDLAPEFVIHHPRPDRRTEFGMALDRKIGARGLRMILEDLMLDMMYQLPSQSDITECVITREVVRNEVDPIVVMEKAG